MKTIIYPARLPEFSNNSETPGVVQYNTWFGRVLSWINISFAIVNGPNKCWINKESLARYICKKYVVGENQLRFKDIVKKNIAEIMSTSSSVDLNTLVKNVVESMASPEIQEVLSAKREAENSQYHVVGIEDYKKLKKALDFLSVNSHQDEPLHRKNGKVPLMLEKIIGNVMRQKIEEVNTRLEQNFNSLRGLQNLPIKLQEYLSQKASVEIAETIFHDLRERTGQTDICFENIEKAVEAAQGISSDLTEKRAVLEAMKMTLKEIQQLEMRDQQARDAVQATQGFVDTMSRNLTEALQSSATQYIEAQKALTTSTIDCQQVILDLKKTVDISNVEKMCGTLEEFGYTVDTLRSVFALSGDRSGKFEKVVEALNALGFFINVEASITDQVETVLLKKSEELVDEIGERKSIGESATVKMKENLQTLKAWVEEARASLASIELPRFPRQQESLIEQRDLFLQGKIERRVLSTGKKLVKEVPIWRRLSIQSTELIRAFQQINERANNALDRDEARQLMYSAAEKEFLGVLEDADAKIGDDFSCIIEMLEKAVAVFSSSIDRFRHSTDEEVRKKIQDLRSRIECMYKQLSPVEGMRLNLPHWEEWSRYKAQQEGDSEGEALDRLLMDLHTLEDEMKIPYELALSNQADAAGDQAGIATEAASSMRMRAACREIIVAISTYTVGDDCSKLLHCSLEKFFTEIQKFPSLAETGIPKLLNDFATTSPKILSEDAFLTQVGKEISSTPTRADIVIPKLRELIKKPKYEHSVQFLLNTFSNSLETDVENALDSKDSTMLQSVLYRMIITSNQSQGKTEEIIRLLGEAIGKTDREKRLSRVITELKSLFQWFPHKSTVVREGIRVLCFTIQLQKETEGFAFPVGMSSALSESLKK